MPSPPAVVALSLATVAEAVATFSVILLVDSSASVEVGVASETDSAVSAGSAFG
jgi:hypothetical protein